MTHLYNRQQLEAVKEIIVQAKPEAKIINDDEKLYAVNFNGVLIGFTCHRGSGRRDFFAPTMSADNQQTIR
jgi:hypothetical protein